MPDAPIVPERLSRVLSLLGYLLDERRGDRVPLADIHRDLGLDRRGVEEDLAVLNLVNFGGGNYVIYAWLEGDQVEIDRQLMSDPLARPARLSPLTARALLLALDLVGDTFTGAGLVPLASVRDKVADLVAELPAPGTVDLVDLAPVDAGVVRALNLGIRERRLVRLTYYTSSRGELRERIVEPYLLFHSGTAWYLEAFCRTAGGERTFRLDLVREAVPSEETFSPRPELEARRRPEESLLPASGAAVATVRFPAGHRIRLEEQGLSVETGKDGDVRARIPYLDERWLVREVLRYAGEAVIEEPAEARASLVRSARSLKERYRRLPTTE